MEMTSAGQAQDAQYLKMTTGPVSRLILSLAVPTIISMLVTSVYNMADTYFVSKLGTSATGAVGIVFSLMAMVQAVGFSLGMGAGSNISRLLGKKENDRANIVGSSAFFCALTFGLFLTALGLFFLNGLMRILGSTPTILPFARDYAHYILLGAPVMCASFVLNNILRSQGRAALAMIGITFGGVLNIALDPIFIFVFHMGISGAAIATLISQCSGFCILLSFFVLKKSIVRLSVRSVSRAPEVYWTIIKTGFPSFCRQGLASAATVALNVNAALYGDAAVAAMSVVGRIFMFILSLMLGFGQGFQPVVGYNYGAAEYGRVKAAFRFTLAVGVGMLGVMALIGFFAAPEIIALFRENDVEVISIGAFAFRAQCLELPVQPLIVVTNMLLQSTGKNWQATLTATMRQGIFFLPLISVLPRIWGLAGVQVTQPVSDFCTALCCIPFLLFFFRELDRKERAASRAAA